MEPPQENLVDLEERRADQQIRLNHKVYQLMQFICAHSEDAQVIEHLLREVERLRSISQPYVAVPSAETQVLDFRPRSKM